MRDPFTICEGVCNGVSVGGNAAGSAPTVVNPSATASTKGSWVQLIAATTYDINWVILDFLSNAGLSVPTTFAVDLGIGASGSEKIIIPNVVVDDGQSPTTSF